MRTAIVILGLVTSMTACKKPIIDPAPTPPEIVPPQMSYINLSDTAIIFNRAAGFDIDGNGEKDIYFTTLFVGDPIYQQDKKQWLVSGSFTTNLPVNASESIPVMNLMDPIPLTNFSGYNWYNASSVILAQKIISINIPPYWAGDWKDAVHCFIPLQIKRADALYNGWIEISFNAENEKVILHKAAICKEPNKDIKAGK